jgi:hypothetical protein
MLASSVVQHACSMLCIERKECFWRLNNMSIDACSVRDNGVLLTGWPVTTVRTYIAAAPGLVGRRNGMLVSKLYSSRAITIPFHPCWTLLGQGRHWRARLRCRRSIRIRSKFGRGYNVRILTPTRAATSSYVMVASIVDFQAHCRAS